MSKEDQYSVSFECKSCGGTILELPDDYTDDSIATCKSCGETFGRWGDIKAKARDAALADVRSKFRSAFKGLKGWKTK